jgi:hypothetical protein
MRGDLSETSAADACRELARRRATGALALDGPEGPGRILFVDGHLIAAVSPTPRARLGDRLVGAGLLDDDALTTALRVQADEPGITRLGALLVDRGLVGHDAVRLFVQEQLLDAMFEIIGWRYGTYEFVPGRGTDIPEVPLELAVDDALVEVARRQQEWDELSQLIPDLDAVPMFREQTSTASASLEPDEFAVLASLDGDRTIRELAADLGYGEFDAARIVYGLALLGVIEVRLPEDEVGAALDEAFAYFSEPSDEMPSPTEGDETVEISELDDGAEIAHEPEVVVHLDDPDPTPAPALDLEPEVFVAPGVEDGPEAEDELQVEVTDEGAADEPSAADESSSADEPSSADVEVVLDADLDVWSARIDDEVSAVPDASADDHVDHAGRVDEPTAPERTEPAAALPLDDHLGEILAAFREEPPPAATGHDEDVGPDGDEQADAEEVDAAASEPPPADPEEVGAAASEPSAHEPEMSEPAATEPAGREPDPGGRRAPAASGDVSEFLRELSRLAIDDPPPGRREEPRRAADDEPPPPRPAPSDDTKRKKRGLFGWGG